jgi:hypothetical protein
MTYSNIEEYYEPYQMQVQYGIVYSVMNEAHYSF